MRQWAHPLWYYAACVWWSDIIWVRLGLDWYWWSVHHSIALAKNTSPTCIHIRINPHSLLSFDLLSLFLSQQIRRELFLIHCWILICSLFSNYQDRVCVLLHQFHKSKFPRLRKPLRQKLLEKIAVSNFATSIENFNNLMSWSVG